MVFQRGYDLELVVNAACDLPKAPTMRRCIFKLQATVRGEEVSRGRCVSSLPKAICTHEFLVLSCSVSI